MAASDPAEPTSKAEALLLQGRAALERGEPAAAVPPLEAYQTAWKEQMVLHIHGHESSPCLLGLAYGLAGRIADAEVVFASTGLGPPASPSTARFSRRRVTWRPLSAYEARLS